MQNSEDGCTRYLMREMDPSEEIEFERQMMKDENLLIEVETLRKTYARLGNLPVTEPEATLTEKVKEAAVSRQREKLQKYRRWKRYLPAAAAVLATITVTGLLSMYPTETEPNTETTELSIPNATIPEQIPTETTIQPWVDRQQTLIFAGTSINGNLDDLMKREAQESLNKLRLVDPSPGFSASPRKIMLTSTNR